MKKLFIYAILILGCSSLFGQENEEFQTIFNNATSFSGYGGPFMSFTTLNGEFAHMMGGGGAVLINRSIVFGGYGLGNTTTHKFDYTDPNTNLVYNNLDIDFGHGGFLFGYILNPKKAIHPAIFLQTGWGGISLNDHENRLYDDNIFVLNPVAELEVNITQFFRMGFGVNYQYVIGIDLNGLTDEDFSSPGDFLSFKFGWF